LGPLGKLPLLDVPEVPEVVDAAVEFIVTTPVPPDGDIVTLVPATI
jgi:hypothetical protein